MGDVFTVTLKGPAAGTAAACTADKQTNGTPSCRGDTVVAFAAGRAGRKTAHDAHAQVEVIHPLTGQIGDGRVLPVLMVGSYRFIII